MHALLSLSSLLLLASPLLATPIPEPIPQAKAPVNGKIRGVRDPIYHLYLQAHPKNATLPVLGPESAAHTFTIGGTIQSQKTQQYLNIVSEATTSYKPLVWGAKGDTTAWGLEGDTIITVQGSSFGRQLNWLVCKSPDNGYYDLYFQTGSQTPSGRSCSNYQTIHLPCLC